MTYTVLCVSRSNNGSEQAGPSRARRIPNRMQLSTYPREARARVAKRIALISTLATMASGCASDVTPTSPLRRGSAPSVEVAGVAPLTSVVSVQAVLDQISVGPFSCSASVDPSGYRLSQTFTVGVSGTLDQIQLRLFGGAAGSSAIVTVYPILADGNPDLSLPLASTTISAAAVSAADGSLSDAGLPYPAADFSGAGLAVTAGEQLAVVLSSAVGIYGWIGSPTFYEGGAASYIAPDNSFFDSCPDFHFRTMVTPIPGATPTGNDVSVTAETVQPDGSTTSVSLVFDQVTSEGTTSAITSASGPAPPSGFKLTNPPLYYDIVTSATFTGTVRVCLSWSEGQIANENNVSLFHQEGGHWVNITDESSRNTVNNSVCGVATSLSPFSLFEVKYPFSGFLQPVDNEPTVNAARAGAAVPVRFSLDGDKGLNIFAQGFPRVQQMLCNTGAPVDALTETVTAGSSSLHYDPGSRQYTYVWKTEKSWTGSCRQLQLRLNDGELYSAQFSFTR